MYCPKCGKQLPDGAKFCSACGTRLPKSQPQPEARPTRTSKAPLSLAVQPTKQQSPAMQVKSTPQWQPATTPELGGPARRIQTNRDLIKYILLTIFTLGIYSFYFIYKMAQDMNTMCEDDDDKTGGLVAFMLLSFFTLGIYSLYWWYKVANRVYVNAPRFGLTVAEKGSSYILWFLLGFVTFGIGFLIATHIVLKNVNALARAYNRAHGF